MTTTNGGICRLCGVHKDHPFHQKVCGPEWEAGYLRGFFVDDDMRIPYWYYKYYPKWFIAGYLAGIDAIEDLVDEAVAERSFG